MQQKKWCVNSGFVSRGLQAYSFFWNPRSAVRPSLCELARNEYHLVESCHPKLRLSRVASTHFTCQLTSDTRVSWAEVRPTESSSAEAFHWSTRRQEPGEETVTTSWLPSATWWHVTPGPSFRQVRLPHPLNHWCLCCWVWALFLYLQDGQVQGLQAYRVWPDIHA